VSSLLANADAAASFGTIALWVLGAYLLLLLWLGWLGYRRGTDSEEDYYLAGRGQGWIVSSLTIMATFFSSFALLGAPGIVYKDGVIFALFALNVPVGAVAVFVLGNRIRRIGSRRGYVTPGDMVSDYYDGSSALRILVALVGLLYAIPYVLIQMSAGGLISRAMFPDNENAFAIGTGTLAVITMLYVMIGGMRSVAWTDVIQGLLLIGGMLLAGVAAVSALGGVGGFLDSVASLPPESLSAPGTSGGWPPEKMLTVCVFASIGSMIQPAQWMRFYAARSTRTLRRSALVFGTVLPICFLFGVMLVGLAGQALYPIENTAEGIQTNELVDPDGKRFDLILVVVLRNHLPELLGTLGVFLAALICVAVMAASMSTADSNLHALSAVFTRDIYARYIRRTSSGRERTWVGRAVIVAATAIAALLMAIQESSSEFKPFAMIALMGLLAISFSTQLLPVTIDMLFVRRGTRAGAIAGIVTGLLTLLFFTPLLTLVVQGTSSGETLTGLVDQISANVDRGAFALIGNVAAFVIVSRFTRKPAAKTREAFAEAGSDRRA
jgi:SSS family solute:Na+ symporter